MKLVWKLLRHHISVPQFVGFFFANLMGVLIVILGFQFYRDVEPVFTQPDSFMSADYLIISKQISIGNTLSGQSNTFTGAEINDISSQRFVNKTGQFTSTLYNVSAYMGVGGSPILSSEIFFESVPDDFVDASEDDWTWDKGCNVVPIILPRTYINMYNFGFAQSRSLPKISEGLVGMIDFRILISGNGMKDEYNGKVIGFSSRLNTILVPQAFMDWSNAKYSDRQPEEPTRIVIEVGNPTDERISRFIDENGYEVEDNKLNAEKNMFFLRMVVSLVMSVGIIISVLSFYILMLSIYLLVQKNSSKLENLLLIGYSPRQVAFPYQMLTALLNLSIVVVACVIIYFVRRYYMDTIESIYPNLNGGTLLPSMVFGGVLFVFITMINSLIIRNKVTNDIWKHKSEIGRAHV